MTVNTSRGHKGVAGGLPFVPDGLTSCAMSKRADEVMRGRSTEPPRMMTAKQRAERRAKQGGAIA